MPILRALLGTCVILALCALFSRNRRAISWRIVVSGIVLQIAFGLLIFRTSIGESALASLSDLFSGLLEFSYEGSAFVFGDLGKKESASGLILAFQVLPIVIYFAALMAILYHLGIMQVFIFGLSRLLSKALGVSGAESMAMGN